MKVLILLLLPLNLMAAPPWRGVVKDLLPEPIKQFEIQKTQLGDIEKKLGKADLVEGNIFYWEKDGFKYAIQLSFDQKKVLTSLHYTFFKDAPSLKVIKNQIELKKFVPFSNEGKRGGRYLILKEKREELTIDPISKSIYSVKFK